MNYKREKKKKRRTETSMSRTFKFANKSFMPLNGNSYGLTSNGYIDAATKDHASNTPPISKLPQLLYQE